MDVFLLIESPLCALYVCITTPIVKLGNAWMDRMERISKPEREDPNIIRMSKEEAILYRPEPTVSDIQPRGYVKVMAMGPGGEWRVLHDYPVRLLPPYIKIVNDRGEAVI